MCLQARLSKLQLKLEADLQSLHLPLQVNVEQAELRYIFDAV